MGNTRPMHCWDMHTHELKTELGDDLKALNRWIDMRKVPAKDKNQRRPGHLRQKVDLHTESWLDQ